MNARIQKWGNSLALRIPKAVAHEAGLVRGSEIEIQAVNGCLEIRLKAGKQQLLADMLRRVRKSNLLREVDFGAPVGKEVW